ncbi:MAG: sister chromatid cohesion protein PDS5 [Promethearchaeota archaeon]
MTSIDLDEEKVKDLIACGSYEKAAEQIFLILEEHASSDKELIYKTLSLLNLICDKSPSISERIIKIIDLIINDENSWIRLVCLEILYQISLYRPNLLIDLIEKIKNRFYDQESAIRRLAVKIIGNLILYLHIDREELYTIIEEFTEKLMDSDWKVKLEVIKTIKRILNQDYTKIRDLEPLLSIVIVNLRDEDDDVARSAAELLKILGIYFLSKEKIMYILLNLLYNEESRVKELIIWLFGEIGKEKSSEIIPIIPKLINLLKEDNYRIQIKVIDALVSIAQNNFDQIWSNLINKLYTTSDLDFKNIIINALYHLSQNNITDIFNYVFEELENPSEDVRDGVALVFKRLFEEYQVEIENEITKILYRLESKYWRERKKAINLLGNVCFILENKKIAVWLYVELEKRLKIETDPDVQEEISYTLNHIKLNFSNIDDIILRVNEDLDDFHKTIKDFQKIPAQFREKMNSYIKEFKFHETEVKLNKIYSDILKKIKKFNKKINKFEYKRLAFNLIEDWQETKLLIIDELSIVKGFISEIFEEKKVEFTSTLKSKIKVLEDRISVLNAQFEVIKNYKFPDNLDTILMSQTQDKDVEERLTQITQLRNYLFRLDDDIREILVNNVEFNEIFKELVKKWVESKIQIQEYLSELDKKIKQIKDKIVDYFVETTKGDKQELKVNGIQNELGFQLFQGHIQSIITQGIEGFKKFNEDFDKLNSNLNTLIQKSEFGDAIKLIEMNSKQIQNFIENYEDQIDNIIGKVGEEKNDIFNLYIRPFITKFVSAKELLINKLKNFSEKGTNKIYLNQIKYYLEVINPINLESLASYLELDTEYLKELIFNFIHKGKLNAKIVNDNLYSPRSEDDFIEAKDLLFFKNIKTIGNKMNLNFKLNNPTNFDFREIQISLKIPSYLTFIMKESFPSYLYLNELKSGSVFKFNYVLKINRNIEKNIADPTVDEITLNLFYKDPFDIQRKTTKKIDLLLP